MNLVNFEKIETDYLELPLYTETNNFDVKACYEKLVKKINTFIDLQCKYFNIMPPKLTQKYSVVYTDYTVSDKILSYTETKLDTLEDVKIFYNQLAHAFRLLNKEEMTYLMEVLYYKRKSENQCAEYLNTTLYMLRQIKESCIVKMTQSLGCAVMKTN